MSASGVRLLLDSMQQDSSIWCSKRATLWVVSGAPLQTRAAGCIHSLIGHLFVDRDFSLLCTAEDLLVHCEFQDLLLLDCSLSHRFREVSHLIGSTGYQWMSCHRTTHLETKCCNLQSNFARTRKSAIDL